MRAGTLAAVLVALLLPACAARSTPEVSALAAAAADPPPRDAHLVETGWPGTAAWIAREARAGRPVVVNLFASWCEPCREELPVLLAAAGANPDVAFLGVAHVDRRPDAEAFVTEQDIAYPTLLDPVGAVAAAFRARGLPATAFFTADGRLVGVHHGVLEGEDLDARLDELRRGR